MASSRSSAETELTGITGLRLEVLTDSRLPNKGPGRATRRQLRAQRARADRRPQGRPETGQAGQARQCPGRLQSGRASKSPRRSTAAPTIRATAGPSRRPPGSSTGRRSRPREPIGGAGGTVLTFKMHHKFGNAWTLGRFRLSVTRGSKPVGLEPAGRVPRDPGDRARGAHRGPEELAGELFPRRRRRAAGQGRRA